MEKQDKMEEKSRTEYSFHNVSLAVASSVTGALLGFIGRIVLTHTLSTTYVGVNGLFLELLSLLSFSELGIDAAMAFTLYRPLAERDTAQLRTLIKYYQKIYNIVGILIFCFGLCLIPVFPFLIKDGDSIPGLRLIYFIYLSTNVLSYPLLYKRTLLAADQREYLLSGYLIGAQFVQYLAQILILLTVKSFLLYVLAGCLPLLAANILSARKINKLYPFLEEERTLPLPAETRKNINRNICATTMQKLGTVAINNTDSLILSSMISVASVALYSNYNLFCRGVDQILSSFFKGIINSVGNLGAARNSDEQVRHVFHVTLFINQWLYGFSAICLYELLSPFVSLCFGAKYVYPQSVVLILCVNVFIKGMRTTAQIFHDSLGLYWYDRYRTLAEAAINLPLSILLAYRMGVAGVFIGTLVSNLLTTFWIEPCILFRKGLHAPVRSYFLQYGFYTVVCAGAWFATDFCCGFVRSSVLVQFASRIALCVFVPNLLFFISYFKTREFRGALGIGKEFYRILMNKLRAK